MYCVVYRSDVECPNDTHCHVCPTITNSPYLNNGEYEDHGCCGQEDDCLAYPEDEDDDDVQACLEANQHHTTNENKQSLL